MAFGNKIGGRSKGTANKATARREKEAAKGSDTPVEYMLKSCATRRQMFPGENDIAKAAAPYVPPSSLPISTQALVVGQSR